jgi:hypothetical protein
LRDRYTRGVTTPDVCLTCYGRGETASEHGPTVCPDCFGEGKPPARGTRLEWRLRELERVYRDDKTEAGADIVWLVHELRGARDALVRVLARCDDADEDDAVAREVKYLANEALGLYEPT